MLLDLLKLSDALSHFKRLIHANERPDLFGRVCDDILCTLLAREGLVELSADDRFHGVPLVGSRAPVGRRLKGVGQHREVGVCRLERRVLQDARSRRDAAVLGVGSLRVLLKHPLDEIRGGLLILGVLRDAEHPVAHHADCLPRGTLRDRLEADLADHGRARAEHRGVDLPGPGRRLVALATGHLLVTLGGVGGVRACLGHRLQVIDQELHSGQRLLIVEDDVPVLVEDVTAERPENR